MACDISAARGIDCRDAIGGLKAIYFTKTFEPDIIKEATVAASSYEITQANFANWSTADGGVVTLYKYDLVTDLSNFTTAVEADKATGAVMWNQTLNIVLQKVVKADLYQLGLISKNRAQIWIQDSNDEVYLMGINDGCYLTGGDSIVTGTSRSDMNGLNMTFTAKEVAPLYIIPTTSGPSQTDYPFDGLSDGDAHLTIVSA